MNRLVISILVFALFSCKTEINKPIFQIKPTTYLYSESKYGKQNDSIFGIKSFTKYYDLKIETVSNKTIALWTEKIPRIAIDSSSSEIDNLLNNNEFINGLTARFTLNKKGDIDSLENWNDVKYYTDSLTKIYYENVGFNNEEINKIKPFLKKYQTKDRLSNKLFRGIFSYHNFYSIDASFDDTLLVNNYSLEMNDTNHYSNAQIKINRPLDDIVDYIVTSDYIGFNDLSILSEFEKLSPDSDIELSSFKKIVLRDTLFYRYNTTEKLIEEAIFKRYMHMDTIQIVDEIIFRKE